LLLEIIPLFQEGAVLPEIISRLATVYGSGQVDIVAVSLFLQDLSSAHPPDTAVAVPYLARGRQKASMKIEDGDTKENRALDDTLSDFSAENDGPDVTESTVRQTRSRRSTGLDSAAQFKSRQKVVCSYCNKVTVNKYTLDTHITTWHPTACQSCGECGKRYGLEELLAKHVRLKQKCPDCDKVFKSKKAQELHSYNHAGEEIRTVLFLCRIWKGVVQASGRNVNLQQNIHFGD
jgi:hypothetical protein